MQRASIGEEEEIISMWVGAETDQENLESLGFTLSLLKPGMG